LLEEEKKEKGKGKKEKFACYLLCPLPSALCPLPFTFCLLPFAFIPQSPNP
jgi:hypothetical protein